MANIPPHANIPPAVASVLKARWEADLKEASLCGNMLERLGFLLIGVPPQPLGGGAAASCYAGTTGHATAEGPDGRGARTLLSPPPP
ncbi:hypothetical protein HYH03_014856 [Edaphochlamys debaryana]|uniref:Uncharacterized protein n=1 Tax=Edaphochlamys debaryana TaxID=47281 RepID=A0A835XN78_9CHLO|nr:hypothetical protein HYH03_014856 [Edaphochlamys debaryana]|eukprot:KAG2486555.1 hypothetical protein HYH03_014856 [Edaphochlamys debaryana]